MPAGIEGESWEQREVWFKECLQYIAEITPKLKSIAFPDHIGCGLGGGDWSDYQGMIEAFASENSDIEVWICRWLNAGGTASNNRRQDPAISRCPGGGSTSSRLAAASSRCPDAASASTIDREAQLRSLG